MKKTVRRNLTPIEKELDRFCLFLREKDIVTNAFWSPMMGDDREFYYDVFVSCRALHSLCQMTIDVHPSIMQDASVPIDEIFPILCQRFNREYYRIYIKEALKDATKKKEEQG